MTTSEITTNPTASADDLSTFERLESEVRSYCRGWPTVFETAQGAIQTDRDGREFLDFFAGAGALNYGHNPAELTDALVAYITARGVTHSLDMASGAKEEFLLTLEELILKPRDLDYRVMFPGPTGTNAVEAAIKLARKVTGRDTVISFTNAFHGMTLGSLALTGNSTKRAGAGVPLTNAVKMPFENTYGDDFDTLDLLDSFLNDAGSGVDLPAAVIVETVQAEGGVNVASADWMRRLGRLCKQHGVLLIVDDIQVGCGRTGSFFSFDEMDLDDQPDIVCLSKSLSAYGLPFAIVLLDPRWDVFTPGEHNGTFRGNNLAFVTAAAALKQWWSDDALTLDVRRRASMIEKTLTSLVDEHPGLFEDHRGRGLIQGVRCVEADDASRICAGAFERGLLLETAGPDDDVVKLLPPLTISDDELQRGLDIISDVVEQAVEEDGQRLLADSQTAGTSS
ncbi:diaminobutyrate--2-oxoglutarate transaminase [Ilumatobacter nonamiensis]|uniref:diaminobutyrate--2-oxoglutarate transaminase n=1 Tax=Ilumatobacter nonamiensis TaxID=467093 RepID=UPI000686750B|nr:diaminobutyrate--2-oxoglutarate transaminase [Ilumatobacter nonamiensis]